MYSSISSAGLCFSMPSQADMQAALLDRAARFPTFCSGQPDWEDTTLKVGYNMIEVLLQADKEQLVKELKGWQYSEKLHFAPLPLPEADMDIESTSKTKPPRLCAIRLTRGTTEKALNHHDAGRMSQGWPRTMTQGRTDKGGIFQFFVLDEVPFLKVWLTTSEGSRTPMTWDMLEKMPDHAHDFEEFSSLRDAKPERDMLPFQVMEQWVRGKGLNDFVEKITEWLQKDLALCLTRLNPQRSAGKTFTLDAKAKQQSGNLSAPLAKFTWGLNHESKKKPTLIPWGLEDHALRSAASWSELLDFPQLMTVLYMNCCENAFANAFFHVPGWEGEEQEDCNLPPQWAASTPSAQADAHPLLEQDPLAWQEQAWAWQAWWQVQALQEQGQMWSPEQEQMFWQAMQAQEWPQLQMSQQPNQQRQSWKSEHVQNLAYGLASFKLAETTYDKMTSDKQWEKDQGVLQAERYHTPLSDSLKPQEAAMFEDILCNENVVKWAGSGTQYKAVQMIIALGTAEQKLGLLAKFHDSFHRLAEGIDNPSKSAAAFGCLVLQQFAYEADSMINLEKFHPAEEAFVIAVLNLLLELRIFENGKSPNGNHVLQALILLLKKIHKDGSSFSCVSDALFNEATRLTDGLFEEVCKWGGRVYEMATNRYGCRLFQRMLEIQTERRSGLLNKLIKILPQLIVHEFGNYVVQHILVVEGIDNKKAAVWRHVHENIATYINHPYAHRIVRKGFMMQQDVTVSKAWSMVSKAIFADVFEDGRLRPAFQGLENVECTCPDIDKKCTCFAESRSKTVEDMKSYKRRSQMRRSQMMEQPI